MNANRANGRGDFSTRITQVERNLHGELLASRLSPLTPYLLPLSVGCCPVLNAARPLALVVPPRHTVNVNFPRQLRFLYR